MSRFSASDNFFIDKTLRLAKRAIGWTNPNPMVGAVIVKSGKIIGSGYHRQVGYPHAEIEALNAAKNSTRGATLYVNLEPCTHYGRTPPCVDAIIQSGIKRVVCSTLDPNPKVHGQGILKLKQTGLAVSLGVKEKEAKALNEAFFTFHEKKRPFIALKFAASLDGKIATYTGDSKWITNEKARDYSMKDLWSSYQAVLVGINTVMKDNEPIKIMKKEYKSPVRIVLDSNLKIPLSSNFLWDNNVIVATTENIDERKRKEFIKRGIEVVTIASEKNRVSLRQFLKKLYEKEIISLLVEGGGRVLGSFVDEKLVDKVYVFHAPILIGGEKGVNAIRGEGVKTVKDALKLRHIRYKKFGDNRLTIGYV